MRLRILSTILSDVLSRLPGAEYERAKREALAAQVKEQRSHIEDLARRLEYTTRQKDEAEEAHVDAYEIRLDKIEGERDAAVAEWDEWKRNCESVQIDRETVKARHEAEKAAHGDAQRHLAAAIAERDETRSERDAWQRSHGTLAREKEQLKVELHTIRARVVELQAGEPAMNAIFVQGKIVGGFADRARTEQVAKETWTNYTIEPLFRSQPAAPAYGVEGELFVCREGACMWLTDDDDDEGARDTGTRAEAEARAKKIAGSKVMRLVDADAPVVDVAKIREVIADLVTSYPRLFASESAHLLRAAIGEKA